MGLPPLATPPYPLLTSNLLSHGSPASPPCPAGSPIRSSTPNHPSNSCLQAFHRSQANPSLCATTYPPSAMASAVCASSSVAAAVAAPSTSKVASSVGAARTSFLGGRALRVARVSASTKGDTTISAVQAPTPTEPQLPNNDRPLWFPGSQAPEWLDGSLPGDFGFDPLGLGSDPALLKWFVQAELVHCRWAMLGAAGIFIPEALTKAGILNTPSWTVAGEADYFADPTTLFVIELILFAWAEGRRWADILKPGCVNVDPVFPNNKLTGTDVGYPGGLWFDPLGWGQTKDAAKLKDLRTREIKNGRLAMLAVLGAVVQANYTHTGPIDNLVAHLADPGHNTIFALSNLVGK